MPDRVIQEGDSTRNTVADAPQEGYEAASVDGQVGREEIAEIDSGREDTASDHMPGLELVDSDDEGVGQGDEDVSDGQLPGHMEEPEKDLANGETEAASQLANGDIERPEGHADQAGIQPVSTEADTQLAQAFESSDSDSVREADRQALATASIDGKPPAQGQGEGQTNLERSALTDANSVSDLELDSPYKNPMESPDSIEPIDRAPDTSEVAGAGDRPLQAELDAGLNDAAMSRLYNTSVTDIVGTGAEQGVDSGAGSPNEGVDEVAGRTDAPREAAVIEVAGADTRLAESNPARESNQESLLTGNESLEELEKKLPPETREHLVFGEKAEEFAGSMRELFKSSEWLDETGGEDIQAQRRAFLIAQTSNEFLKANGLPPVTVSAEDLGVGEIAEYNMNGHVAIDKAAIKKGGSELAGTVAHELTHHEQATEMVNRAQKNGDESDQRSLFDYMVLEKTGPRKEFHDTVRASREGQHDSPSKVERGEQLIETEITESPNRREHGEVSQLKIGLANASSDLFDAKPDEFLSYAWLESLHQEAPNCPTIAGVLNSPHMTKINGQLSVASDGIIEPWDEQTEATRKMELAHAFSEISADNAIREGSIYTNFPWEVEARYAEKRVEQAFKNPGSVKPAGSEQQDIQINDQVEADGVSGKVERLDRNFEHGPVAVIASDNQLTSRPEQINPDELVRVNNTRLYADEEGRVYSVKKDADVEDPQSGDLIHRPEHKAVPLDQLKRTNGERPVSEADMDAIVQQRTGIPEKAHDSRALAAMLAEAPERYVERSPQPEQRTHPAFNPSGGTENCPACTAAVINTLEYGEFQTADDVSRGPAGPPYRGRFENTDHGENSVMDWMKEATGAQEFKPVGIDELKPNTSYVLNMPLTRTGTETTDHMVALRTDDDGTATIYDGQSGYKLNSESVSDYIAPGKHDLREVIFAKPEDAEADQPLELPLS